MSSIMYIVGLSMALWDGWSKERESVLNPFHWNSGDPRTFVFCVQLFTLLLLMSFVAACSAWCLRGWLAGLHWETLILFVTAFVAATLPVRSRWNAANLFGLSPDEVWSVDPRSSDTTYALLAGCLIAVVSVTLPIRACLLWIPLFLSWTAYTVLALSFPADYVDIVAVDVFALGGTVFFCFCGAWMRETHIREKWLALYQVQHTRDMMRRQESDLKDSSAMARSMQAVAEALCDVVVMLQDDLRIGGLAAGHAAFLGKRAEGAPFTDLLSDSDRERFLALLSRLSGAKFPEALSVTLKLGLAWQDASLLVMRTAHSASSYIVGIRAESPREFLHTKDASLFTDRSTPVEQSEPCFKAVLPGVPDYDQQLPLSDSWELGTEVSFALSATTRNTASVHGVRRWLKPGYAEAAVQTYPQQGGSRPPRQLGYVPEAARLATRPGSAPLHGLRRMATQPDASSSCTPTLVGSAKVHSRSSSRGSSQCSRARGVDSGPRILEQFRRTPHSTIVYAVSETFKQINWCGVKEQCCLYHACLQQFNNLSRRMSCYENWQPYDGWQCPECSALNPEDIDECGVCLRERVCPTEV